MEAALPERGYSRAAGRLCKVAEAMSDFGVFRASLESPDHTFSETLAYIAGAYDYQPRRFTNGSLENAAGENEGSCRSEEHTSELQSRENLVCRLLLEKKNK